MGAQFLPKALCSAVHCWQPFYLCDKQGSFCAFLLVVLQHLFEGKVADDITAAIGPRSSGLPK